MGDPKQQKSLEVRVSNIVDHHDPHIDKGSDDKNKCSVHYKNGEALHLAANTITIAFFNTYDRRSTEIVDVRQVPRRFALNIRTSLNPENRTSGCVIFVTGNDF
jgi:hypothetical protein